ncbi:MAG TPA: Pr6Pr family membrane protein [Puia sp.]|nr:Pr6Pr family membrane protein [Puia sp.]
MNRSISIKNAFKLTVVVVAWFGLILQFYLFMKGSPQRTYWEKVINYFSYFTILTNMTIAVGTSASLFFPKSAIGNFCSNAVTESGFTVYILIVGIIYHFFLRNLWDPQGSQWLSDWILHKATPILYFFYWAIFVDKGYLKWVNSVQWLVFPLVYFVYSLIRGASTGFYAYPFIEVNKIGYPKTLVNAAWILAAFLATGIVIIIADKIFVSRARRREPESTK